MTSDRELVYELERLAAAISARPSVADGVMRRLEKTPRPVRRRSRWKLIAAVGLTAAACVATSVVGWMTFGRGDATETASADGTPDRGQPVRKQEGNTADAYDSKLGEDDRMGRAEPIAERSRAGGRSHDSQVLDAGAQGRGRGADRAVKELEAFEPNHAAFSETPRSKPQLSDFAGLWRGKAVDKPEDGTATDPLDVKLNVAEDGQLEGVAFGRFTGGGEARLEDVFVVGDRLEFKVRHRTGIQMQVTLGLAGNTLKGDGIPIRSDESRCDIVLQRQPPDTSAREDEPPKP